MVDHELYDMNMQNIKTSNTARQLPEALPCQECACISIMNPESGFDDDRRRARATPSPSLKAPRPVPKRLPSNDGPSRYVANLS